MTLHLPLLTTSELKVFRRCVREHHYAYRLGMRSVRDDAEALRFGSLIHLGLEAIWRAYQSTAVDPLAAAVLAMTSHALDDFDLVRATILLQGYVARWPAHEYEVIGVELEFCAPLINPDTGSASRTFQIAGKLDVLVRRRSDGVVLIIEHKTTSADLGVGSMYWQLLTLDSQVSMYFAGARALGFDVGGCVYDVIKKPRHSPLKATPLELRKYTKKDNRLYADQRDTDETLDEFQARLVEVIATNPDAWYQRGDVVRLEADERDAGFDVWQAARTMREAELAERYPRNPDSCQRFNRLCNYWPVCTGAGTLGDPASFVHVDNVHSELSGPVAV